LGKPEGLSSQLGTTGSKAPGKVLVQVEPKPTEAPEEVEPAMGVSDLLGVSPRGCRIKLMRQSRRRQPIQPKYVSPKFQPKLGRNFPIQPKTRRSSLL
jgi:hypothetical protein